MPMPKLPVALPLAAAIVLGGFTAGTGANAAGAHIKHNGPSQEMQVQAHHKKAPRHGRGWHGNRPGHWGRLGPRQIRRSLRYRGFHKIRIIDARGPVYVVKARGWYGQKFRLVVDAFNGRIIRQRAMGYGYQYGYRW